MIVSLSMFRMRDARECTEGSHGYEADVITEVSVLKYCLTYDEAH